MRSKYEFVVYTHIENLMRNISHNLTTKKHLPKKKRNGKCEFLVGLIFQKCKLCHWPKCELVTQLTFLSKIIFLSFN
jgi:hypothetical protein